MIWDEQNNSLETDTSLNLNVRRVDYPGYWGGLSYQVIDGYDNIPIFDSQGSTRYGYWITGNMFFFNAYIYDAFGNLLSTPPAQPNQMQYGGRFGYYTDATGLGYVRARYYDPVNGRWVSRDPIGFDGGDWNVYGYVANMPIFALDPSGTASPFCSRPAVCCCCAGPASLGTVTRISNSQTMGHTVPFDLSVVGEEQDIRRLQLEVD